MTTPIRTTQDFNFDTGEIVAYPAHGLGRIVAMEEQEVAGSRLELFVVFFEKDRLTLRVPTATAARRGMRRLAEPALIQRALEVLRGRVRVSRTMWSRRATEYQAKINSGDLIAVAEVVRDLYRSPDRPHASHRERELYEAALDTLWREIATVNDITESEARKLIQNSTKPLHADNGAKGGGGSNVEVGREEAA